MNAMMHCECIIYMNANNVDVAVVSVLLCVCFCVTTARLCLRMCFVLSLFANGAPTKQKWLIQLTFWGRCCLGCCWSGWTWFC